MVALVAMLLLNVTNLLVSVSIVNLRIEIPIDVPSELMWRNIQSCDPLIQYFQVWRHVEIHKFFKLVVNINLCLLIIHNILSWRCADLHMLLCICELLLLFIVHEWLVLLLVDKRCCMLLIRI